MQACVYTVKYIYIYIYIMYVYEYSKYMTKYIGSKFDLMKVYMYSFLFLSCIFNLSFVFVLQFLFYNMSVLSRNICLILVGIKRT